MDAGLHFLSRRYDLDSNIRAVNLYVARNEPQVCDKINIFPFWNPITTASFDYHQTRKGQFLFLIPEMVSCGLAWMCPCALRSLLDLPLHIALDDLFGK